MNTYMKSEHYIVKYISGGKLFYAVIGEHQSNMFVVPALAIEYAENYIKKHLLTTI